VALLTGRVTGGYRGGPIGSRARRGAAVHLGWEAFARCYRAELDALPTRVHMEAVLQLAYWMRTHGSVTLLTHERVVGGDEAHARTQRRLLREWLLGLPGRVG